MQIGNRCGSGKKLSHIVSHAACHTDACHTEKTGLFQEPHNDQTEQSSREGIYRSENSAEKKPGNKNPDQVYRKRVSEIHLVQCDNNDEIGKTQLDSGNTGVKGNQRFHIGKNQRKTCEHGRHCKKFDSAGRGTNLRLHRIPPLRR